MTYLCTPSKPDYFRGTPTDGKLTVEQLNAMESVRFKGKLLAFRKKGGMPEIVITRHLPGPLLESPNVTVRSTCPVVAITKDGTRCCVIAPNGMEMWETMK